MQAPAGLPRVTGHGARITPSPPQKGTAYLRFCLGAARIPGKSDSGRVCFAHRLQVPADKRILTTENTEGTETSQNAQP